MPCDHMTCQVYLFGRKWLCMPLRDCVLLVSAGSLTPMFTFELSIASPHHFWHHFMPYCSFLLCSYWILYTHIFRFLYMHRAPLLVWALLLSLDNIITPWVGARCRSQSIWFVCLCVCLMLTMFLPSFAWRRSCSTAIKQSASARNGTSCCQ